ncbi:MAG TPA: leucyl/phenylalanyl-tRNA--protein transferase [Planctomycetota bacterium]|nr:leucyl/phenylalanyl-tRNA--protein transferase [Planctomycetota bacterium]
MLPIYVRAGARVRFPDPTKADADGLVVVGGDLSVERLIAAYRAGIFPWFDERTPPLWWSPDPRGVITPESLHVPRRLWRTMRSGRFSLVFDGDFTAVMRGCAADRAEGTWIIPAMIEAYTALHRAGLAHSVEVLHDGVLAGGIYGVHVGGVFAAESMFHRVTDASKVALVALAHRLFAAGVELMEVQFVTAHLQRFGAFAMPRRTYLERLRALRDRAVDLGPPGPFALPSPPAGAAPARVAERES